MLLLHLLLVIHLLLMLLVLLLPHHNHLSILINHGTHAIINCHSLLSAWAHSHHAFAARAALSIHVFFF